MQEYKNDELVKASEGAVYKLLNQVQKDFAKGVADQAIIATIQEGDEFEIKGLKFVVKQKMSRGRIQAKLKGVDDDYKPLQETA